MMVPQIETLPGAMLLVEPAGRICDLNDAGRRLVCRLRKGENLINRLDVSDQAELESLLNQRAGSSIASGEFEVCIDSHRYRLTVSGKACADDSRFVQITDITEYRALSERLAENEQRYRSLFSQNPDAVCSLDLEGRLVDTNHCTEYLTGQNSRQLRDYPWESLVDESDRDSARLCFEAALKGSPCSYRCKVVSRDGRRAMVQVTYIPTVVDGQVVGVFGVARDKTERYRLEESRRLLQACMAQVQDVIIITETDPLDDPGPRIVYVNDGVQRMTGYRPEEILGNTPRMFQGPETDRAALDRIKQALNAREPIKEVVVNYCKDGLPFWNEIEIVPIPARSNNDRAYFASVQRDITQTKQREAELRISREELRRLSRAQDDLLEQERLRIARDLHDELGQMLTALKLSLGMAVNDMPDALPDHTHRMQKMIGFVDDAVERVREISSNLRPAMLDDLGFEAAAEWFLGECAGRSDFDVKWHSVPSGGRTVKGEVATALYRILQECITNISRHSNASSVIVRYRQNEHSVHLEIEDDGEGFDPGQVQYSGFGLVGIRERVAMMQGKLTVESAIGKGVRVVIELPLEDEP